jgi:hypothetical protein
MTQPTSAGRWPAPPTHRGRQGPSSAATFEAELAWLRVREKQQTREAELDWPRVGKKAQTREAMRSLPLVDACRW